MMETSPGEAPRSLTLDCGTCTLRGYDYGNQGAPPLVLVHGMQDFALAFDPLAQALRGKYRVVTYDLRGHGDSDKPGIYTMPHLLADLHAVIVQLELERPRLVGHSLGGQVVSQYAGVFADMPEAVVNVEGLGPPMRESDIPLENRQWNLRTRIQGLLAAPGPGRPMMDLEDAATLFCRFHPGLDIDRARSLVALATDEHPHGGLKWKWDPRVQSMGLTRSQDRAEELWSWITCPTLLITAGKAAEFFARQHRMPIELASGAPEEIERRVALFRSATHVEIPDAGHMVHFDALERLIDLLEQFLDSISGSWDFDDSRD